MTKEQEIEWLEEVIELCNDEPEKKVDDEHVTYIWEDLCQDDISSLLYVCEDTDNIWCQVVNFKFEVFYEK